MQKEKEQLITLQSPHSSRNFAQIERISPITQG